MANVLLADAMLSTEATAVKPRAESTHRRDIRPDTYHNCILVDMRQRLADRLRCASSVKAETYSQPLGTDRRWYNKRKERILLYSGVGYSIMENCTIDLFCLWESILDEFAHPKTYENKRICFFIFQCCLLPQHHYLKVIWIAFLCKLIFVLKKNNASTELLERCRMTVWIFMKKKTSEPSVSVS